MDEQQDNKQYQHIRPYFLFAALFISIPVLLGLYKGHTGRILVSTDVIGSRSCFNQTVVYVFNHSVWGAQGVILNKPLSEGDMLKYKVPESSKMNAFDGGPVDKGDARFIAILRPNAVSAWRQQSLYVTTDKERISKGQGSHDDVDAMLFVGYSGWSPNQLEREIREGAWVVTDVDYQDVSGIEPRQLWALLSSGLKKNEK